MSALSDSIERFIKELMDQSCEVSLQRNELAQHFSCAPSQINYVLSTRFTLERGYLIVSKRGGGGYIRVKRLECEGGDLVRDMACNRVWDDLSKPEAYAMIARLWEAALVTEREAGLMKAAVDSCGMPTVELQDGMRARMMRGMLSILMQSGIEEE